jgi:predicted methyltransferase
MNNAYSFTPVKGYWFTSWLVKDLKNRNTCLNVSLDLGLTRERVCVNNNRILIKDIELDIDSITPSEEDRIVLLESDRVYEIAVSTLKGYYKLKATGMESPPTLEINGIHMHRIVGLNPWEDATLKASRARIRQGSIVLDTCTGLGYTAIASIERGASKIVSTEIDPTVLWIAERNPWSRGLRDERITIINDDVLNLVKYLEDSFFDRIIHDPPRFSASTGDLYGLDFYRELFRVLKPGGVLYHYTGLPGFKSNYSILKGIKNRLEKAGFSRVYFDRESQGFIAWKLL